MPQEGDMKAQGKDAAAKESTTKPNDQSALTAQGGSQRHALDKTPIAGLVQVGPVMTVGDVLTAQREGKDPMGGTGSYQTLVNPTPEELGRFCQSKLKADEEAVEKVKTDDVDGQK